MIPTRNAFDADWHRFFANARALLELVTPPHKPLLYAFIAMLATGLTDRSLPVRTPN